VSQAAPELELVVARCHEPVLWLRRVPEAFSVRLYNKGEALPPGRVTAAPLPNTGREAHTYLTHLVENYDRLAEVTVFAQGHPFDHASDFHAVLRGIAAGRRPEEGFEWLGFIVDTDDPRGRRLFVNWSKNPEHEELPLDETFRALFGEEPPPLFHFHVGAQFAVSRGRVRGRPRAFYERALALSAGHPLAAHCFERMWDRVFDVRGVDPASLGPDGCRYLKPIRRLRDPGSPLPSP
jgi:hypothetical protein